MARNPNTRIDKSLVEDELAVNDFLATEVDLEPTPEPSPNVTTGIDGGATVNFGRPSVISEVENHYSNLADAMSDEALSRLSSEVSDLYSRDKDSRKDWEQTYVEGLGLLGMKIEERSQPFSGASGAHHPLLAESVTQFQAQAYKELLPSGGPVRCQIMGEKTSETEMQAQRVREFMNYQITHVMEEYDPDMDQLLFYLPLCGSAFKKIYYDESFQRPVSKFIPSEELVIPYTATDLESSPRVTHTLKMTVNDLRKLQVSGFYRDIELKPSGLDSVSDSISKVDELSGKSKDHDFGDDVNTLLEMHVDLDLEGFEDENGIKLPYIVTIDESSNEVLAVKRNWLEQDASKSKRQYFVHYKFLPGLGFYGFGLIHMIGGLSKSATSILRQLIDSGTLANLPAGFKARGLRVKNDDEPLSPGEFRDVDAPGGAIRDALMPLPYKEPSPTLFQLLGFLVDSGRRFASITELQTGDIGGQSNQMPVGTTLALLERGTKVMSAVHKRLHCAQRIEFKLLASVIAESLPEEYPYNIPGGQRQIKASDFDDRVDIIPVSDPNIFSMSQRVIMAQSQLQMAQQAPQIHNLHEAYYRMYVALGIQNIEEILPNPDPELSKDPASENADALVGRPLRAYAHQNHQAHLTAHTSFVNNPIMQQNQQAGQVLQSHIQEHLALQYRQQVEELMKQQLPAEGQQIPPDAENQIAQAAAKATEQLTKEAQEMMAKQQQLGQFDPMVQIKQQEVAIKGQEVQRKQQESQQKQSVDIEKEKMKATVDMNKIRSDEKIQREKMRSQEKIARMTKKVDVI